MFEVLFEHIDKKITLTKEEEDKLKPFFIPKKYRKRQYMLLQGDVCKYIAFVEKDILRSYQVDDKGNEHVIQFAPEGWWIADNYSFLTGNPSNYDIDVLEDAEVLLITKLLWRKCFRLFP